MSNNFSKEEKVAFDEILEGYNDALIASKMCSTYMTDQQGMERSGDTFWRPIPYIMDSYSGVDQTANFKDKTQLSVPASINTERSTPFELSATELRDALQEGKLGKASYQKLASDMNASIMDIATAQGSLVVTRTTAATGFTDVAACEAIMNEQGIGFEDRVLALSTRDYNGMAANLASRSIDAEKVKAAYERAFVGRIASFDTYKLDYANRIAVAAGSSVTINTLDAGLQFYDPVSTTVGTTGTNNTDNRFQTVTVSDASDIAVGDAFTIAAVYAVHHITKKSTGQLKTFRVVAVPSSTTITITPPIISNQVESDAATQYQNCTVSTKAANSAIVFLNTVAASINPFWYKDAIEILPGKYAVPTDAGAGVMRASTDQGFELVMTKQFDIHTLKTKFRIDARWGVVNKAPEMSGILLFSQSA